jgi:hypothetical protein
LKTTPLRASLLAVTLLVAGVAAVSSLLACAAGSSDTGSDGGAGADGTTGEGGISSDTGIDTGGSTGGKLPIGSPCKGTSQCASPGSCTQLGMDAYCTEPCPSASCPTGTYCSLIENKPLCVPDLMQECLDCTTSSDCKLPSDACLTSPQGDQFCARDCTPSGDTCPTGFKCVDKAEYPGPRETVMDGGSSGGTESADAGAGSATKWCVPNDGASCKCDAERNGVVESCSVTNKWGTCTGQTTCIGATGKLQACNAQAPAQEICNGVDDNCNGQIDEGTGDELCSFMGPTPVNSSWVCMDGACSLGPCAQGWTAFPPGPLSNGCACAVNPGDSDGLCDMAIAAGSVTSMGGSPLVITGTLSSATAVAVYSLTTTDVNETTTDSYDVSIAFTKPTTNTEFVMDVIRGDPCSDTPSGGATDITSYDWCVNATSATAGLSVCGPTAVHHCADESSDYFIRVYRAAGATPTCTSYEITITGGGGTCDLTQSCM